MSKNQWPRFSWKEADELLEKATPILSDSERQKVEAALTAARIVNNERLRDATGMWLLARLGKVGDMPPLKRMEGTPEILPDSHSLTAGMTGYGKTVLGNTQVVRIAQTDEDITAIVVDVEGDRAPFIITELERSGLGDRWLYFDAETIQENMFQLAGHDPLWFDHLARVFVELGFYGDIGLGNLRRIFMDVNAAGEMQRRGGWATLDEALEFMKERMARSTGKKAQYLETAVERFEAWIPSIAPIFRYRTSHPWPSLRGHVILYDIRGLTFDGQLFFQNYTLQKLLFIQERGL